MKWTDLRKPPSQKVLRQFAGAGLGFGLLVAGQQWMKYGHQTAALILVSVAVLIGGVGLIHPAAIRWGYTAAMLIAFPIGWVVSQLVLALIFYGLITPLALVSRWRGRDVLLRARPDSQSLWLPKEQPQDLRRYFRQY